MGKKSQDAQVESTDRRDFLKTASTALAGVGAVALLPRTTLATTQPKWDKEVDVVIAGYGGAGAVAAIAAHDAGADVLLLESTAKGGGTTQVSTGGFMVPKSAEEAITYISGLFDTCFADKDEAVIRAFAQEAMKNIEWLQGLREGVKVMKYGGAGYPKISGAAAIEKYMVLGKAKGLGGGAANLFDLLRYALEEKRKIPVMVNTPARELVTDCDGKVIGVIAENGGKKITIGARRGVVLTTGGFEANPRMLQNYVKGNPIHFLGHPGNKGDGIHMAQKAGADLWHMRAISCPFGLKVPDHSSAFFMLIRNPAHILVDKHGKRFANESHIEPHASILEVDHYDTHAMEYPRIPCYAIFDEAFRKKGQISLGTLWGAARTQYTWSKDNLAEIEKGWIIKGDTVKDLAKKINMEPETLDATLTKWNQDVAAGSDTLFGREVTSGKKPLAIDAPPLYAVELHPALLNTQGGPRRNAQAQIMNVKGNPIPGLYSAGSMGSLWGMVYQGAGNIAECMAFGRIAGRNAAANKR